MPTSLGRPLLAALVLLALATRAEELAAQTGLRFQSQTTGTSRMVYLLCNCDASDMPDDDKDHFDDYDPDTDDDAINGEADEKQLEPITIPAYKGAGPVRLRLVNLDANDAFKPSSKVRIFGAGGREIIGPRTSDEYELAQADLAAGPLRLMGEGLNFSVTAKLQLLEGDDVRDELTLHVAPLMMLPDTQPALSNLVVQIEGDDDSATYVESFVKACKEASASGEVKPKTLHDRVDVWIQDEMLWGYTSTPRTELHVAMHLPRSGDDYAEGLGRNVQSLLSPQVGYVRPFSVYAGADGGTLDYGGNIEVTPPFKGYPFGRLYYGGRPSPIGTEYSYGHFKVSDPIQRFFKRQKRDPSDQQALQEPLLLYSNWLFVGHVDEFLSFIPADNDRGYVLLYADPLRGIELLDGLDRPQKDSPFYLGSGYNDYLIRSVGQMLGLNQTNSGLGFFGKDLRAFNTDEVWPQIKQNVDLLQAELGLADADMIGVPVIFCNHPKSNAYDEWGAMAVTPGIGNLSAMGKVCLVPDPHIPAFADDVRAKFKAIGQKAVFIDDWKLYHFMHGEVHCGSNARRQPFKQAWWEASSGEKP